MLTAIVILLISFVLLKYSAELLVHGAKGLSLALGIPAAFVGSILVAFGTSAPELIVNLVAAHQNHTEFALGNVAGSNVANLLVGFGICGCFGTLLIDFSKFRYELLYLLFSSFLLLGGLHFSGGLTLWLALLFIVLLLFYVGHLLQHFKSHSDELEECDTRLGTSLLWLLLGAGLLYAGGHYVVESALKIGGLLGVSDVLLGLTVVAVGTSIPDIMASLVAFRKGENEIAIGNLLGSNILNILVVLSATVLVSGAKLESSGSINLNFLFAGLGALMICLLARFKKPLRLGAGIIMLLAYLGIMAFNVLSNIS